MSINEKEQRAEALGEDFIDFASEYPQSALALITDLFVGLLEHSIKKQGGNAEMQIKIDGGKRDITIHATRQDDQKAGHDE